MLITRTPNRFSFYGGGLDYPQWYSKKQVRVLCAGLDYYCYQTIRELPPFFDHNYRASYSKIETTSKLLMNYFTVFKKVDRVLQALKLITRKTYE